MNFYFDYISPYAYLAASRIEELAARHGREVRWIPILLAAVLNRNGQKGPAEIPDKRLYTFKHVVRLAAEAGLPLEMPPAHPFNPLLALRMTTLHPRPDLIHALFRAAWGTGQGIETPEAVREACAGHSEWLDLIERAPLARDALREETEEAMRRGVFGVPSVWVEGELFWGYDSFPHLETFLEGRDPVRAEQFERWRRLPASATRI